MSRTAFVSLGVSLVAVSLMGCGASTGSVTTAPTEPNAVVAERPPPVDLTVLRTEYGKRKDFFEICERDRPVRQLLQLVERKAWSEVLATSEPWLSHCPVDIEARLLTAVALKELGRASDAEEQVRWYGGLLDSILDSGDGRSPQTAFVVISIPEEYAVLRVMRLRRTAQQLRPGGIDALSVEGEDGQTSVIYFNPAAHLLRLHERLRSRQ